MLPPFFLIGLLLLLLCNELTDPTSRRSCKLVFLLLLSRCLRELIPKSPVRPICLLLLLLRHLLVEMLLRFEDDDAGCFNSDEEDNGVISFVVVELLVISLFSP